MGCAVAKNRRPIIVTLAYLLQGRTTTSTALRPLYSRSSSSSTTIIMPPSSSSSSSNYQGRVVARLLHESEAAKRLCSKPMSAPVRIDPSTLHTGAGTRPYRRPNHDHHHQACGAVHDDFPQVLVPASSESTTSSETTDKLRAVLEVLLYNVDMDNTQPCLELNMDRDATEPAHKTLQRLQLSLAKKLPGTKKESAPAPRTKPSSSSQAPQRPAVSQPTLRLLNPADADADATDNRRLDNALDLSDDTFTNWHLCQQSTQTPLAIDLTLPNNNDQSIISLWVESCPPSILAVHTFEDFGACLFVDVPIVVTVEILFATRCRVDWYCNGALVLQDSPCFVPSESHVDATLSVLLTPFSSTHNGDGCQEAYQFQNRIQPLVENTVLSLRPTWSCPRISTTTASTAEGAPIRIMTYNILADQNAFARESKVPYYSYVNADILARKRRLPLVLHELVSYHADVLCLQEVDELVYDSLLFPVLQHLGYNGAYAGKQATGTREGCALFWNAARFELMSERDAITVSVRDLVESALHDETDTEWPDLATIVGLLNDYPALRNTMTRQLGHVAQMALLADRTATTTTAAEASHRRMLWVVNTHLFYHPRASHIRLFQMFLLARELEKRRQRVEPHNGRSGVVFCGDWNSSLDTAAGKLLVDRVTPTNYRDLPHHLRTFQFERQEMPDIDDNDAAAKTVVEGPTTTTGSVPDESDSMGDDFPSIALIESFPKLSSALSSPAPFTHWVEGFVGCLDHIVASDECLVSVGSAPMPTEQDVTRDVAMPSANLPSDHVSLVCDLVWKT